MRRGNTYYATSQQCREGCEPAAEIDHDSDPDEPEEEAGDEEDED